MAEPPDAPPAVGPAARRILAWLPRPGWEEVLLAFAVVDTLLGAGVLVSAHLHWPALAALAGAALALMAARSGRAEAAAWILVLAVLVLPQAALIALRPATAPVQDGLLITDAAAGRLLHGLDPYGHDYLDAAALRAFWIPELPVNPLLAHYVYPPGMILLAVAPHLLGLSVAWLWLPAAIGLALAGRLAAGPAGVVALALSPLLLLDYLYLFNDLFFLAAGVAGLALLARGRAVAGGFLVGAALLLKQPAVLLLPAAALLAGRLGPRASLAAAAAASALVLGAGLPFLAWSPRAFLTDTGAYFYGAGVESFPIRGPGLSGFLLATGVLPSRWAAYPSAPIQLAAALPTLVAGWVLVGGRFAMAGVWLWTAALALETFLLGRTLAPNYVTIAVLLLSLAWAASAPRSAAVGGGEHGTAREAGVKGVA